MWGQAWDLESQASEKKRRQLAQYSSFLAKLPSTQPQYRIRKVQFKTELKRKHVGRGIHHISSNVAGTPKFVRPLWEKQVREYIVWRSRSGLGTKIGKKLFSHCQRRELLSVHSSRSWGFWKATCKRLWVTSWGSKEMMLGKTAI